MNYRECEVGSAYRGTVAILEQTKATASNGPYLRMILTDGQDNIVAKYWQYPYKDMPTPTSVFGVVGIVGEYQGRRELNIKKLYPMEELEIEALRRCPVDVNKEFEEYCGWVSRIQDSSIRSAILMLVESLQKELMEAPGAKRVHHDYVGGLLEHTNEVTRLAVGSVTKENCDIVIAGSLLHDIGKVSSYEWVGVSIQETRRGQLHGHIPLGYGEWMQVSAGIDEKLADQIGHIILSHHGKLEWGSPVEPRTIEAMLVHQADMISSKRSIMQEALEGCTDEWTEKIWPLGVRLYNGGK